MVFGIKDWSPPNGAIVSTGILKTIMRNIASEAISSSDIVCISFTFHLSHLANTSQSRSYSRSCQRFGGWMCDARERDGGRGIS